MAMYKGETKIKDIYVGTEPIVKVYAGEEFCGFFTLSAYNLVANSDLLIPKASPNENEPLGFTYTSATDISLTNGIAKFTATARFGKISPSSVSPFNTVDKFYHYAKIKSDSALVGIPLPISGTSYHSGSGNFEFISNLGVFVNRYFLGQVFDYRTSDWTPIEVDCMGAINITDLVSRGILPSGLTDAQYKTILDNYFNS